MPGTPGRSLSTQGADWNFVKVEQQSGLCTWSDDAINVRVAGVCDRHGGASEISAASGSQINVRSLEVVHIALRKHGVVLQLRLPYTRGIRRNKNHLRFSGA